jgi:hypothetical protein
MVIAKWIRQNNLVTHGRIFHPLPNHVSESVYGTDLKSRLVNESSPREGLERVDPMDHASCICEIEDVPSQATQDLDAITQHLYRS